MTSAILEPETKFELDDGGGHRWMVYFYDQTKLLCSAIGKVIQDLGYHVVLFIAGDVIAAGTLDHATVVMPSGEVAMDRIPCVLGGPRPWTAGDGRSLRFDYLNVVPGMTITIPDLAITWPGE